MMLLMMIFKWEFTTAIILIIMVFEREYAKLFLAFNTIIMGHICHAQVYIHIYVHTDVYIPRYIHNMCTRVTRINKEI